MRGSSSFFTIGTGGIRVISKMDCLPLSSLGCCCFPLTVMADGARVAMVQGGKVGMGGLLAFGPAAVGNHCPPPKPKPWKIDLGVVGIFPIS